MSRLGPLLVAIIALALTPQAWGWGRVGHSTVGEIAQGLLTPDAAKQVARLLKGDLAADGEPSGRTTLGQVASWPDEIRGTPAGSGKEAWHFEDIAVCGPAVPSCSQGECAPAELKRMIRVLKNKHAKKRDRNEALKWVVHLVGDIHQPLHAATNDDHGGNFVEVSFFGKTHVGEQPLTLHHIWDTEMVERMVEHAGGEAAFVAVPISAADESAWKQGSIDDWVAESNGLARSFVYPKLPSGFACGEPIAGVVEISDGYYAAAAPIVTTQLRRAGVRLAAVLNAALAPPAPHASRKARPATQALTSRTPRPRA